MADKLIISGASGKLGKHTLELLLAKGIAPANLIATTRDPSKLADFAAKGVDVRKADFDDPATLTTAFAGGDRLALISTDSYAPGIRLKQHVAAVSAAEAAGIKHIIYTSMPNPTVDSKIVFAGDHRGTEEAIQTSKMTSTILRVAWYQENMFMSLPKAFETGQWFTSAGDGKVPHISHADCAEALAAALASSDTESKIYNLTGPEKLTNSEVAAIASEVVGKPLTVINLTDEQLADGMKQAGVPEPMIPFFLCFDANTRVGGIDILTDDFETLTGKKPKTVRAFFEANKAAF